MLHHASVEHDAVGLKGRFEVSKPLLKSFSPRFQTQTLGSASSTGQMFFQATRSRRMRLSAVLQVRYQRSVAMKRGAEACADGQRQHASCITVARTVVTFSHGHRIGIVDHGKPSAVESLEGLCNIEPDPSLAEVGCGRGPTVDDSSWKPDADRPVPVHRLQCCLDGGENLTGLGRRTVFVPFQFADQRP